MLVYKTLKRGDQIACSSKECTFAQLITGEEKYAGQQQPAKPEETPAAPTPVKV
jgi:hypothetical protein